MKSTVNLRDLVILVADPSAYTRRVINGMLRGFGANKILEAEQSTGLFQALSSQKISILLCDLQLPPWRAGTHAHHPRQCGQ